MYYHGNGQTSQETDFRQAEAIAISPNGIDFTAQPDFIGAPYARIFHYDGWTYALGMPGVLYRSRDPLGAVWEERPERLFTEHMRHGAVLRRGETLHVLWSNRQEEVEHIRACTINLAGSWTEWHEENEYPLLYPEMEWEGGNCPAELSRTGPAKAPARQLRDPCIFVDDDLCYLLYAVAGERGIAIARMDVDERAI